MVRRPIAASTLDGRRWPLRGLLLVILCCVATMAFPPPALAASIDVNSLADTAADDGECTLREAILAANTNTASGAMSGECVAGSVAPLLDTITFSVSGVIMTGSGGLPTINDGAGDDDGWVEIDGANMITLTPGVGSGGGSGIEIGNGAEITSRVAIRNLTIEDYDFGNEAGVDVASAQDLELDSLVLSGSRRGISIRGDNTEPSMNITITNATIFDNVRHGIRIEHGSSNTMTIRDSVIGLDTAGDAAGNGDDGIQVGDGATEITITDNVISANTRFGIDLNGNSGAGFGHVVDGNFIGTNLTGDSCGPADPMPPPNNTFGNGLIGLDIQGGVTDSTIRGNTIGCNGRDQGPGGSQGDGIELTSGGADNNTITDNFIGTNAQGDDLGNAQNGVEIRSGDDNEISGNVIAFNGFVSTTSNQDGIDINGTGADGNRISQNSIYNNDGLGIDLNGNGVTDNDNGDGDTGSNERQNWPFIETATWTAGNLALTGCFDPESTEGPWTLEFFCNDSQDGTGNGEGRTYAGSIVIAGGVPIGNTNYSGTPTCPTPGSLGSLPLAVSPCHHLSATATNNAGNTSEFGTNAEVLSCTLTPITATNQLPGDTQHTVNATVARGGVPIADGTVVDFSIVGGPNSGASGSPTSVGGVAAFLYTHVDTVTAGTDTIEAEVTEGGETATCLSATGATTVTKTWLSPAMAVQLEDFDARRRGGEVVLQWRTISEFKHVGFHLLRQRRGGEEEQITEALITDGVGELGAIGYHFVDRAAPDEATRYWLIDVDRAGRRTRHGPAIAPPQQPSVVLPIDPLLPSFVLPLPGAATVDAERCTESGLSHQDALR